MRPTSLLCLGIALLALSLGGLAAIPAMAGEDPPVVVLTSGSGAFAHVRTSAPGGVQTDFRDDDACVELACGASAQQSAGGVSGSGSATHSVTLDPDDKTLLVATGQGSASGGGGRGGASASAARLLPRGGGPSTGSAGSSAGGFFFGRFEINVPVRVEFSASLGASPPGRATVRVTAGGEVVIDSEGVSPQDFSAEVPAGSSIQVEISAGAEGLACGSGCSPVSSSGSFSFDLTLTPAAPVIRWVNAAGGSWDDASNWDPEQVPGEGDRTLFDLGATYAVNFPAASAATSRGVETCASPRSIQSTQVRAGTLTYTGAVDVSTLSDSAADPGLRIGGAAGFDDAALILESGELCSLFSTVGDTAVSGTASVTVQGGVWTNQGRLVVGGASVGVVTIEGGSVVAGETRVGDHQPGTVQLEGPTADLDTGALLVGAPGMLGDAVLAIDGGSVRSDAALIGATTAICLDEFGLTTQLTCAVHPDCAALGRLAQCQGTHSLEISDGEWSTFDPVRVGGGTIVADDGTEFDVAGNGFLGISSQGRASMPGLYLGTHAVSSADTPETVSRGYARVSGTLDVAGSLLVGAGGAGILEIVPGGTVDASRTTIVGAPPAGRILPAGDPHVPGAFRHGYLRIGDTVSAVLSGPSLLRTARLFVRTRGRVELDAGRIEATEQVRILSGGRVDGPGVIDTPDFAVGTNGTLGPVFPIVVGNARTPRGTAAPGSLTIAGNLTLEPGAVVAIGALGPGVCGRLEVTGNATLGGTLELAFPAGYLPAVGDGCDIVSVAGTTTGAFERVVARGVAEGFRVETTIAPDGSIAFTALTAATACAGSDQDGDGVAVCERCDNCVDDTGNGFVDREDPDCVAPADGAGLGLPDAGQAAAVLKCHRGLQSAAQRLVAKTWKDLQRCTDAMTKCHQQDPDDPQCLAKAEAKCAKAAAKLEGPKGPAARATARIEQDCGALPVEALLDAAGLGHAAASAACASVGVNSLTSAGDIAACTTRRQVCQLGGLIGAATPRASELLTAAGIADAISCVAPGADGGGAGLGNPKGSGKRAASCQKALGKAASKLLGQTLAATSRCEAASLACVQREPGDASCFAKAESVCSHELGKLASAEAKLQAVLDKKCGEKKGKPLVALEDLLTDIGLGFSAGTERCEALGIPVLDSRSAVGACLVAENQCRAEKLGEAATPRSRELLTLGGAR